MKTLKKRILSSAMAGVLALSLAVPAFASGTGTDTTPANTTNISGGFEEPDIDVVVPTTGTVVINPYGLGTTATKKSGATVNLTGQVMTAPLAIKNKTEMKLAVGAEVTTTPATGTNGTLMKLTTGSTKGVGTNPEDPSYVAPATGKSAFIELEVVKATGVTGTDIDATGSTNADALYDAIIDACADPDSWTGAGKLVLATKAPVSGENLATLSPATFNNGAFASYAAGSIGLFRLTGDCTSGSKAGWTEDDTLTVSVAFNFTPVAPVTSAITLGSATIAAGAQTAPTATVTLGAYSDSGNTTAITTAKEGDTVYLNQTGMDAADTITFTVTGASGATYTATRVGSTDAHTFVMPDEAVTITANVTS